MLETQNATETNETEVTPEAIDVETAKEVIEQDETPPAEDVEGELKVVRKALDKRNRYINSQRNRIRALEAKMEKMRSEFGSKKSEAPDLEKFDSVIDYMKADQNFTLEQKLAEQTHKAQMSALEQQQQMALQQQAQEVAAQVQELLSSNPDFKNVITSNSNVINAMPPHIEKMFAELDDAPAATYALAKEGRLQSLYSMPPAMAAAHLVQAEIRGQQYLGAHVPAKTAIPAATTQQAPKPISSLKGTGKSQKSVEDMSPDQLMNWLKS